MKISHYKSAFILSCALFFSCQLEAAVQGKKHTTYVTSSQLKELKRIPSERELAAWEERVVKLVNQVRAKFNLGALKMKKELCKPAKDHSANMAFKKCGFGHDGFQKRATDIINLGRHNSVGENVAYTYLMDDPVLISMEGWMESQGHRENILGDYDETGVGIVFSKDSRCYITQLFAKTY